MLTVRLAKRDSDRIEKDIKLNRLKIHLQMKNCDILYHFHNALNLDVFLIWKLFTYFWSWRSSANRSVDKLCNVARDQIINDICDNRVCQNYSKKSAKQQKRHLSL